MDETNTLREPDSPGDKPSPEPRGFLSSYMNIVGLISLLFFLYIAYLMFFAHETRFAPGYSEKAFQQVDIDWTRDQVVAALGEPLFSEFYGEDFAWSYVSSVRTCWYDSISFDHSGKVINVQGMQLPGSRLALKGKTREEVLNELGEPVWRSEGPESELMVYSEQAANSNFKIRYILVGEDGKVDTKKSEFFRD